MTVIFGNINYKIPNKKNMEKLNSRENPSAPMFPKPNQYFLNDLYKKVSPDLINSYKGFYKFMLKYAKMGGQSRDKN